MFNGMSGILPVMDVDGGNRNGNGWGGDGGWWVLIILFALFGWGGNGAGGFGGNQGALTRGDLCQDMNFNDLQGGVRGLATDLQSGFRTIDNAVCTLGYNNAQLANGIQMQIGSEFRGLDNAICTLGFNNQAGFNALANQLAQCCCEQKQESAQTRYDMAQGFAQLDRTISDQFCQLKSEQKDAQIAALQNELNVANLAASQTAQNQYLVDKLRPCPIPSFSTCNPWATNGTSYVSGFSGTGCGCGCGNI